MPIAVSGRYVYQQQYTNQGKWMASIENISPEVNSAAISQYVNNQVLSGTFTTYFNNGQIKRVRKLPKWIAGWTLKRIL